MSFGPFFQLVSLFGRYECTQFTSVGRFVRHSLFDYHVLKYVMHHLTCDIPFILKPNGFGECCFRYPSSITSMFNVQRNKQLLFVAYDSQDHPISAFELDTEMGQWKPQSISPCVLIYNSFVHHLRCFEPGLQMICISTNRHLPDKTMINIFNQTWLEHWSEEQTPPIVGALYACYLDRYRFALSSSNGLEIIQYNVGRESLPTHLVSKPAGLAYNDDAHQLYVGDAASDQIHVLAFDELIQTWYIVSSWSGFKDPKALLYHGPLRQLFVADSGHNRIATIDVSTGRIVRSYGNFGPSRYLLYRPHDMTIVTIGRDMLLIVADTWNHRIQTYHI